MQNSVLAAYRFKAKALKAKLLNVLELWILRKRNLRIWGFENLVILPADG